MILRVYGGIRALAAAARETRSCLFPNSARQVVIWRASSQRAEPLLLENGKVHPAFNQGSKSRLLRNGVGVAEDGTVVFAISDAKGEMYPNLFGFADLFRSLGCKNALFLDGDISQMRFGKRVEERSNRFGSVIAVVGEVPSDQ